MYIIIILIIIVINMIYVFVYKVRVENNIKATARAVQRYIADYRDRHKSLVILLQTVDQANIQVVIRNG